MKSTLNITHNSDTVDISEAMVFKRLVDEGYIYPINELELTNEDFKKFLDQLSNYKLKEYDFTDSQMFKQFVCDEFWMNVNGTSKNVYMSFNCKSLDICQSLFNKWKKFAVISSDIELLLTAYYMRQGNVEDSIRNVELKEFEGVSELYYPYLDVPLMCKQLFSHKENILVLCGKPGTGKTKLTNQILKYALNNPDIVPYFSEMDDVITAASVKNTEILAEDSWWGDIAHKRFSFIILDDLDYFLTPRDSEVQNQDDINKNKFINQFLSFTDGLEKNQTKFIITTNQPFNDMDTALMRSGRMFNILELRSLKNSEALAIWIDCGLEESKFPFKEDVLQADLGSAIEKHKNKGISLENYVLEENISKMNKKRKKVGI